MKFKTKNFQLIILNNRSNVWLSLTLRGISGFYDYYRSNKTKPVIDRADGYNGFGIDGTQKAPSINEAFDYE
jgi:hypothetical protein